MARERRFPVGALNIAMYAPHSTKRYVELFNRLYSLKRIINIGSLKGALIGNIFPLETENSEVGLTGEFYYFIQLDAKEPWFDLERREEALKTDIKSIVIPDKLKPHLARFPFIFFPKGHRLYVQLRNGGRSFGIKAAATVIRGLIEDPRIKDFGMAEVTVEPDKKTIDSIFKIPHLSHLKIELVRPNPDDHHDAERRILQRLQDQGARKMVVDLSSGRSGTLNPDEETETLARVAASNGVVYGKGRDMSDQPVEHSTQDKAWIESAKYDPDIQRPSDALYETARKMHDELN